MFLTSKQSLLHCWQILDQLSHQGNPKAISFRDFSFVRNAGNIISAHMLTLLCSLSLILLLTHLSVYLFFKASIFALIWWNVKWDCRNSPVITLLLEFFFIYQLFYIIWAPTLYSMLEKHFKAHITFVWVLLVLYSCNMDFSK